MRRKLTTLKNILVREALSARHKAFTKSFGVWERLGFHVIPVHYYQPVPDTRQLPDSTWTRRSELAGIDMDEQDQLERLRRFHRNYAKEYDTFPREPTGNPQEFYLNNVSYRSVDAEILYCMVRELKPARIYEIGSGFTTRLSAAAILKNQKEDPGYQGELVAFEPYPVESLQKGFPGFSRLEQKKVQDVPLETWQELQENDILFIDSSHVVTIGSDVVHEVLEILPRLKKGVVVHIHDIFLPMEMPRPWVMEERRFWDEQYLVQAFLAFNGSFRILWAGHFIHVSHPEELAKAIASYPNRPADQVPQSLWIQKVA